MFGWLEHKSNFCQVEFTADCHCHLLPGVDDGVKSFEESLECLRIMREVGVKSLVLTPHVNPDIFPENTEERIRSAYERYLEALPKEMLKEMKFSLAAEYMVVDGFEHRDMSELLQIEPGKVLVEMSYMYPSPNIEETIFNMVMAGITPVLAHPERYQYYADSLETFNHFRDMGAEFQLNLLSLGGGYGRASVRIMEHLMNEGMYGYVGSDTHSPHHFRSITEMKFSKNYLSALGRHSCCRELNFENNRYKK